MGHQVVVGKELRDREYEHRVRWISDTGGRGTELTSRPPSIRWSRRDARGRPAPGGAWRRRVEEGGHSFFRGSEAGGKGSEGREEEMRVDADSTENQRIVSATETSGTHVLK